MLKSLETDSCSVITEQEKAGKADISQIRYVVICHLRGNTKTSINVESTNLVVK